MRGACGPGGRSIERCASLPLTDRQVQLALAGFLQQLLQVLLPHRCPGMGAMPVGLGGGGKENELPSLDLLDFALCDAQLRRVDEIVS